VEGWLRFRFQVLDGKFLRFERSKGLAEKILRFRRKFRRKYLEV